MYKIIEGDNYISITGKGLEFQVSTKVNLYILREVRKAIRTITEIKKERKGGDKNGR